MGNGFSCFEKEHWVDEDDMQPYRPALEGVYMDMTLPLTNYFISSGHNSYLTGNQLVGSAGTSTIVQCLKAGCRVIELDVYDGPVCTHGGTLVASVTFKECVEAIAANAFECSPFPVIITMELHANEESQARMAELLRELLGDKLHVPPPGAPLPAFGSPMDLQHRVLCRASLSKVTHPGLRELIYICNAKLKSFKGMIAKEHALSSSLEELSLPKVDELEKEDRKELVAKAQRREALARDRSRASSRWSDRRRLLHSLPAVGSDQPPDDAPEPGADIVAGSLHELYTYTARHLMRVYPAGWRVLSGNYGPMRAWVRGASLAALNWQVWDEPLWCNQGKFLDNGGCGYVLKPEWMRCPGAELPARSPRTLKVHLHSAYKYQANNWFVFKDDLFVKITLWGMPVDRKRQSTHTAANTGRLKVGSDFKFPVRFPEMAVLCIQLMDEDVGGKCAKHADADCLGYCSLPLATLAEGEFKLQLRHPSRDTLLDPSRTWVKAGFHWEDSTAGNAAGNTEDNSPQGPPQGTQAVRNPLHDGR